ncbi:MAG TPA: glycosyltransferase family 4 protein [Steroidobacteraceae bacterium]|nr:glycosyltransferase family 4 protein [Candidatus Acidoferrales bacterium]HUN24777.1 glycosyltransferase family 4 protein [Steroidobacteraceae bacterium]
MPDRPLPSVVVANLSAPEINRLGVELERRGVLRRYVRPYANKGRRWERAIERVPGVGRIYARTLGRRSPPRGLPLHKVIEAGIAQDFLAAAFGRLPLFPQSRGRSIAESLTFAAERAVACAAGRLATAADIVVASYGTGRCAFEEMQRSGGRTVLSYPIAHNRYQARMYAEEAALAPEFAAALPRTNRLPSEYLERLEVECALADCILVGSGFVRDSFVAIGCHAEKIAIVPYGVDTARFVPPSTPRNDRTFRVLFVGQIGQRKGMSYLLQGYEQFRRPDCELHIVGSYLRGHEVYRRFTSLYRHTPHLPQSELPALFHEADVFVLPSLIEGMPLVILEAMACGVPVITTTHGPGDVVRDGIDGFFVPIRDSEAIAARLEQLYRDRQLRDQMGANARERALQFTWDRYARAAADVVLKHKREVAEPVTESRANLSVTFDTVESGRNFCPRIPGPKP